MIIQLVLDSVVLVSALILEIYLEGDFHAEEKKN